MSGLDLSIQVVDESYLARDGRARIICRTVRELGRKPNVPGAVVVRCCECCAEVWCAPSSRRLVGSGQAKPLCVSCSTQVQTPISGIYVTREQYAEAEARRASESARAGVDLVPGMELNVVLAWDALRRMQ